MSTFSNTDDIIDVRDIIERLEELREELTEVKDDTCEQFSEMSISEWIDEIDISKHPLKDEIEELQTLENLLSELCGNGGDEQWEGDWYPVILIRESYFENYMDEMLEDCGDLPKDLPSYLTVTVDYVALQTDYSSVEIDGSTYLYR